ncbi:site-specific integrase [Saccharicrinis sp. FJH54]|uniref:site-specific integrase n=1 Tax=Saccharicrinis sp. FJH54 TaxID=3344665 RepID=UPI0035D4F3B1
MAKNTFNVLIRCRLSKKDRMGKCPLLARVTIQNERADIGLAQKVLPSEWDEKNNLPKGPNSETLLSYIEQVRADIFEARKEVYIQGKEVTAINVKRQYLGIKDEIPTVLNLYDKHNEKLKERIGIDIAEATMTRHYTSRSHVAKFILSNYNKCDYPIDKINLQFLEDYVHYLKVTNKCNHNTTKKYVNNLGKVIRIAIASGFIKKDPFLGFKMKYEKVYKPHLTEEEIYMLLNYNFRNERLSGVRDVFVFCCMTGLAFIDVKGLTMDAIINGMDGKHFIENNRHKTNERYYVPVFPITQQLMDKYIDHPLRQKDNLVLPVISNQKMNAYLKEIADVCNIDKKLSTHVARHTFATTVTLSNGVPIEAVSKMLGHSNIKITQQYAKVTENLVSESTKILHEKFSTNEAKSGQSNASAYNNPFGNSFVYEIKK